MITQPRVLVIEVDDSSHKLPEHLERDKFKDDLFWAVGLPLLRLDLQSKYSNNYLCKQIEGKLKEPQALSQSLQTAKAALKSKTAQQGVQLTVGTHRVFQAFSGFEFLPFRRRVHPPTHRS